MPSLNAASVLDAHYTPTTSWTSSIIVGKRLSNSQTFTVLTSGYLTSVDILVARSNSVFLPNHPLRVDIRGVVSGMPSEPDSGPGVFGSANISPDSVGTQFSWIKFTFPASIPVESGDHLAIILMSETQGAEYQWAGDFAWPVNDIDNGTYAGGMGFNRGDSASRAPDDPTPKSQWGKIYLDNTIDAPSDPEMVDFSFRAYVNPIPEPSSMILILLFGLGLIHRRNRINAGS